jgi:hypothetical protein
MSLKLTDEQKEKLCKLEQEMKVKREMEEKNKSRKEASSKETGIPLDVVDMDVIKIGMLLGLIKKKSVLEGKEKQPTSLLGSLLGLEEEDKNGLGDIDYSKIPREYKRAPDRTTESTKIQYHQQFVQQKCDAFSSKVSEMIKDELEEINKRFCVNVEERTLERFKEVCMENLEILLDDLDPSAEEEFEETLANVCVLRNALLGSVDVCEYRRLVRDHVVAMKKSGADPEKIASLNFTANDARLSLYKTSLKHCRKRTTADVTRLLRELEIRSFTKPPELKPFDFSEMMRQCCTPALAILPATVIMEHGLIGPFRNNPVGFLQLEPANVAWAFYFLSKINADGVRLWILDNDLTTFANTVSREMSDYVVKILKTFYLACFETSVYKRRFWKLDENHADVFENCLKNLFFLSDVDAVRAFLKKLFVVKSPLIPTEYDFFNHVAYYSEKRRKAKSSLLSNNLKNAFPEASERDLKELFGDLNEK